MTTENHAKTTVRPVAITMTYHSNTSQLNKNHPFGMSITNVTDAITKVIHQTTSTAVTKYCNEQKNNTGEEGTHLNNLALDNFSSVLDHVLSHKVHASTKMPCVNTDLENQIKEMKFKVSPDIRSGDDNNTDFKNEVKQIKFQVSSNISNTGNKNTDIKNQVKDNKFQVAPNNSNSSNKNTDFKNQVKEVKFQVSPDISNVSAFVFILAHCIIIQLILTSLCRNM